MVCVMTPYEILCQAIKDYLEGDYENPRRHPRSKCEHGESPWETCEGCIDEHFTAALARAKMLDCKMDDKV